MKLNNSDKYLTWISENNTSEVGYVKERGTNFENGGHFQNRNNPL